MSDFKPPILRLGKVTTKTRLGMKKKDHPVECICKQCVKPRSPWKKPMWNNKQMKKRSDPGKWIDNLRRIEKLAIIRIYKALGYPPHIQGCQAPEMLSKIWDLDEIGGRHTMGHIPGALWPREMQLLRRCCHMRKTAQGHVDYRPEAIKQALWEASDLLVSLLPETSGSNQYSKKDLSKAIRKWGVLVSEKYPGDVTEAAL